MSLGAPLWAKPVGRPEAAPDPSAYADDGFGLDASLLSVLQVGYTNPGAGLALRVSSPILPNGWIDDPALRDALQIELGLDAIWFDTTGGKDRPTSVTPQLAIRYTVYLFDRLAGIAGVGVGYTIVRSDSEEVYDSLYGSVFLGGLYDLSEHFSLRVDGGFSRYLGLIQLGVLTRF